MSVSRTPCLSSAARQLLAGTALVLCATADAEAELEVILVPGIDAQRNFERAGSWDRQWVRSLPPGHQPFTEVVRGPDTWSDLAPNALTPAETAAANRPQIQVLLRALAAVEIEPQSASSLLAGRIVALLRPVEPAGRAAPGRYARLWQLWEVLADAPHVDTLSAAFAATQAAAELGSPARLACYPAVTGSYVYGVLVPRERGEPLPGTSVLGAELLLPISLAARPLPNLAADDVSSWSWPEVLSPGWGPAPKGIELPPDPALTGPGISPVSSLEDLCTQAEVLGLRCLEADSVLRDRTLATISSLLGTLLLASIAFTLRRSQQRRQRVALTRAARRGGQF